MTGEAILKSNWAAVVKFNMSTLKMKVPIEKGSWWLIGLKVKIEA